ncbi:MAG: MlaD family protein, partial [Odoribacter sp.]|nr:MlaD family protein [Odoribacter sp.]
MIIKREVKLAMTAIVAVVILIWGINFLKARALFDRNNVVYGVYDQVDGLKVSSSVIYRGYGVGQVSAVSFAGDRFDKVLVQFTVGKKLEIPSNSIAVIQSADLMGSKAINLIPGDAVTYAQSGDTLRTQLELGIMEQLNEHLEPLKKKAENIMVSLDTVLLALQEIFSENATGNIRGSLKSVSRTLNNVEEASGTLNRMLSEESGRVSAILENINSITGNLEGSNAEIARSLSNISTISDSLRAINLNNSIRYLNGVLMQVDSIVKKINHGKGSLGGMVNDAELYYNLAAVSENLDKLLVEFRQNPKRFVNLSVFDFGSGKNLTEDNYGIVIAEAEQPLPLNSDLYLKYPDLKEIRKNGKFFYLLHTYKNLKQAQNCQLYTSDAAADKARLDIGG